jgi:hypothetical protein
MIPEATGVAADVPWKPTMHVSFRFVVALKYNPNLEQYRALVKDNDCLLKWFEISRLAAIISFIIRGNQLTNI